MKQTTENPEMAQDSGATETRDFGLDSKGENGPVFDISKADTSSRFRYKSGAPGKLVFERVNEATWKLTGGEQTNVPTSHGQWGGYRTSKAVAWLIDVGETAPAWLARCRDHCCGPSTLREAKAAALAMAKGACGDYRISDPVQHLNGMAARLLDAGEATSSRGSNSSARRPT
jgi:hypothetical protein